MVRLGNPIGACSDAQHARRAPGVVCSVVHWVLAERRRSCIGVRATGKLLGGGQGGTGALRRWVGGGGEGNGLPYRDPFLCCFGGAPCAVPALCEKSAVFHHQ